MTQYDDSVYEEILKELENSFKEGKIDESSYQDLKQRYVKKLEEAKARREETRTIMNFQVSGSQRVTDDAVKISGSANLPGGVIPKIIKIAGSGRIESDIECNGLRCAGSLHAGGRILSHGDIHVSGSFHGNNSVLVEGDVDVSGSAKVDGDFDASGIITVSGSMKADGDVNAKGGIRVFGSGKVDGNMYSDKEVDIKGSVKIDGSVVAETVKFTTPHVFKRLIRRRGRSQVDGDILGKELVEIENIEVDGDVRGKIVKIGPNSKISGNIEFVEDLIIAEDAELENQPMKVSPHSIGVPTNSSKEYKDESPNAVPKFCPKCGQEVGKGLKFCPACGSELSS
ncbi:MAG: polymer-forming cytoskeletal protein [Candidatus Lokiarchaeota archaeon]|nr:polymer-forming cytoskeletal protein [Candidatus Lokiarchaeota archaeon]